MRRRWDTCVTHGCQLRLACVGCFLVHTLSIPHHCRTIVNYLRLILVDDCSFNRNVASQYTSTLWCNLSWVETFRSLWRRKFENNVTDLSSVELYLFPCKYWRHNILPRRNTCTSDCWVVFRTHLMSQNHCESEYGSASDWRQTHSDCARKLDLMSEMDLIHVYWHAV